jgi:hypothetical protein
MPKLEFGKAVMDGHYADISPLHDARTSVAEASEIAEAGRGITIEGRLETSILAQSASKVPKGSTAVRGIPILIRVIATGPSQR